MDGIVGSRCLELGIEAELRGGDDTHSIYDDGDEDGRGDGRTVLGVIHATDELVVLRVEEEAQSTEDQDGEDGDDGTVRALPRGRAGVSVWFSLLAVTVSVRVRSGSR